METEIVRDAVAIFKEICLSGTESRLKICQCNSSLRILIINKAKDNNDGQDYRYHEGQSI